MTASRMFSLFAFVYDHWKTWWAAAAVSLKQLVWDEPVSTLVAADFSMFFSWTQVARREKKPKNVTAETQVGHWTRIGNAFHSFSPQHRIWCRPSASLGLRRYRRYGITEKMIQADHQQVNSSLWANTDKLCLCWKLHFKVYWNARNANKLQGTGGKP